MNVRELMTRRVVSARPEAPVKEAIRLMESNRISGIPVADAGGRVIGVVSERDGIVAVDIHLAWTLDDAHIRAPERDLLHTPGVR